MFFTAFLSSLEKELSAVIAAEFCHHDVCRGPLCLSERDFCRVFLSNGKPLNRCELSHCSSLVALFSFFPN